MDVVTLLRIKHWIKNLLIIVPFLFGCKVFDLEIITSLFVAFLSFSFIASAVYIINDINDKQKDKNHPVKCNRPIASERISVTSALFLVGVLLIISFALSFMYLDKIATVYLLLYCVLNVGYSFGLKNFAIVDVCIIVSGFVLRIMYGGAVVSINISDWLYLTVFAVSFYFAFGKRRNELQQHNKKDTRKVLTKYPIGFLDKNMYMCLALANAFYAIWAKNHAIQGMIYTVPIVMLLSICYSFDIEHVSEGDPVEVLTSDIKIMCLVVLYIAVVIGFLYLL